MTFERAASFSAQQGAVFDVFFRHFVEISPTRHRDVMISVLQNWSHDVMIGLLPIGTHEKYNVTLRENGCDASRTCRSCTGKERFDHV